MSEHETALCETIIGCLLMRSHPRQSCLGIVLPGERMSSLIIIKVEARMAESDRVIIEGLEIQTIIGIYEWERSVRQTVRMDLDMAWDIRRAAESDDITHALNYKSVAKRLTEFVESTSFGLVETLAEHCAHIIMDEFNVAWLRLKLCKPGAVSGADNVGVLIERGGFD